jgi:hypothetical protein
MAVFHLLAIETVGPAPTLAAIIIRLPRVSESLGWQTPQLDMVGIGMLKRSHGLLQYVNLLLFVAVKKVS